jgi:hypothetical protein
MAAETVDVPPLEFFYHFLNTKERIKFSNKNDKVAIEIVSTSTISTNHATGMLVKY